MNDEASMSTEQRAWIGEPCKTCGHALHEHEWVGSQWEAGEDWSAHVYEPTNDQAARIRALEAALTKAGELLEWAEMELRSLPSSGHEAIDRLTEQNIHRFLLDHAELTQTLFYSEARAALRSEGGD